MEDHKDCRTTDKFVHDALCTLKTIERITDKMMEENCDPIFVDIMFLSARSVLNKVCPQEVEKRYPHLKEDEDFNAFIDHVLNHSGSA